MKVRFHGKDLGVRFDRYREGDRVVITLMDEDGAEYVRATVNIPEIPLPDDLVLIKDYSENAGVLDALVEAGIVRPTGVRVGSGFVEVPVCQLLVDEGLPAKAERKGGTS